MLPEYFAIVGSLIASLGGYYYLYCTIKGTVQPNRVTWFFWGLFPMIAFAAQLSSGVGLIAWATFFGGLPPFLVVLASFLNPKAYWKIERLDYVFAATALIGVALWQLTDNALFGLLFSMLADFAISLPTLIKSWCAPESENATAYLISTCGFLLALAAVQSWTILDASFLVYLAIVNGALTFLVLRGNRLLQK